MQTNERGGCPKSMDLYNRTTFMSLNVRPKLDINVELHFNFPTFWTAQTEQAEQLLFRTAPEEEWQ